MDNWDYNTPNFIMVSPEPESNPEPESPGNGSSKRKKKKEKVFLQITKKGFVLTLICCMLATSALTVGGLSIASRFGVAGTSKTVSATNYTLAKSTGSELSVEEIIAKNEKAVVEIKTESVSTDNWMQNYVTEGAGSGVIIDTKGYIITNNHVVDGASKITVTLKDEKEYTAKVVGTDESNDIAVLKISASGLTAATYGDSSDLSVGDMVVAIGNPLGELGGTATAGILSSLDRELTIDGKTLSLLQTDASINPGNSGGGLFDNHGNLIGIVVAKSTGSDVEGLGFAIPVNTAAKVAKDIIKNGKSTSDNSSSKAVIGVNVKELTAQQAMQYGFQNSGVYIAEVTGSKAKQAGLQAGDMIYYVDNQEIKSYSDLSSVLSKHKAGDSVTITVIRDNQTQKIKVQLSESSDS